MPFPDLPAGPVKSEPVINRLQEKVFLSIISFYYIVIYSNICYDKRTEVAYESYYIEI